MGALFPGTRIIIKSGVKSGDLAKFGKKRNTDYDFPHPFTINFVGAEKTVSYFIADWRLFTSP